MFTKSHLALVIGAVLAAPAVANVQTDEHLVVEGREFGYKADTNSTAMRMEMTQLETPGQVTVIDETVIDEQRASTLGEVLRNDASVSAGGTSRNRERFSLRGFELSSSDGFLRDGRQHWSHYRQPIELLERVEVLKGPSGLLYGKSEPGGLVNMVSKKPTTQTQVSLSQDIGSNEHSRTVLDVSGSLNDAETLRARAIFAKENYSSWRTYGDGTKPQTDRVVGGLVVEYDITENIMVSAHYDRTKDEGSVDSGAYIVDGKPVRGDKYIWDAQWSKIDNDVENYGIDINAQVTDNVNVKAGYNRQDFKRFDVESYPKFDNYDKDGVIRHKGNERTDNWVFDTAYLDVTTNFSLLGTENTFLVGANYLDYKYDRFMASHAGEDVAAGTTVTRPGTVRSKKSPRREHDTWGIYAQNMMTINDYWQVLAGARYDEKREDSLTENQVSPKLGVIFHPTSNGSIYVQYSESFMPQGEVSNGSRIYINDGEKLDAERGISYEIGTKWELFDQRLFVSGAVFDITLENISLDVESGKDAGNQLLHKKTQGGEQVHKGAELMAQGFVTPELSLTASAMYLDAELKKAERFEGNRPADVPEFSASLWSSYKVQDNTNLNLGLIYEGDRYGDAANTFKKDGYARIDMGVSYKHKYDENLDIIARFNVENLFDTDYLAGGGSTNGDQKGASGVVVGEERNYMATIQFKY
ncbi:TonB-dependent siderophore enterobactin receptor PeuA [Vibrio parahaemolyticus]|uniref:TonB-dependent siderophore enterobactin receptor PeuA n=1 Tax=Vibrio parahaemolyticus TaxID=670 RepID=UPI0003E21372|nr:TonB-dependent siderophore enterobactin receptor PeuA [Vibrio parahaemolyticus]EGR0031745.1 TonB-dependent siderophore receptor [Vibrio parahaemolyticus]EGR0200062.1 TonB-dependent siderophore receptor [Vibrio parahaemolyticus]EGR2291166.1 TonB-dependent siderophore receptor [Vibrio parahaemolyticus]EGR9079195.1 TonB-dependent siderophore enterobactin receptor PeuA [Vibrio parahaemolyticus]EHS1219519.1 TonB-dependent siderophore enterobactin receptor PeuA [Vibrio parahaemolyticus]